MCTYTYIYRSNRPCVPIHIYIGQTDLLLTYIYIYIYIDQTDHVRTYIYLFIYNRLMGDYMRTKLWSEYFKRRENLKNLSLKIHLQ